MVCGKNGEIGLNNKIIMECDIEDFKNLKN